MALDHSRLGLENEFLENKSGRIFDVRQVYLTKSCQQIWVQFFKTIFHNFSSQIFRTIEAHVGFWQNRSKNFKELLYGQPVLTFDKRQIFSKH